MLLKKSVLLSVVFLMMVAGIRQSSDIDVFIQTVQDNRQDEPYKQLYRLIEEEAEKRKISPINAKIDQVWKAIPGYNGLEVDVETTFHLAKQSQNFDRNQIRYVYREVEPQTNLDDLGAQPIYKGNPKKPMISFMINVAWGNEFIPSILQTLKDENVHATFFFDGSWLSKNIEIAKQIQTYGHEVSNHAYSHKNMSQLSRDKAIEEIVKTERLLQDELKVNNQLFAPPSGDFNIQTVKIAHELQLKTVLWTIDTVDWKKPEPSSIVNKISSRLEPGALILMHPTSSSSEALPGMIKEIKRRGLVIGTVSELLSSKRVSEVE